MQCSERLTSSETRKPQAYIKVSIAPIRFSAGLELSDARAIIRRTSSSARNFGKGFSLRGGSRYIAGLSAISFSVYKNLKNSRIVEILRQTERVA